MGRCCSKPSNAGESIGVKGLHASFSSRIRTREEDYGHHSACAANKPIEEQVNDSSLAMLCNGNDGMQSKSGLDTPSEGSPLHALLQCAADNLQHECVV